MDPEITQYIDKIIVKPFTTYKYIIFSLGIFINPIDKTYVLDPDVDDCKFYAPTFFYGTLFCVPIEGAIINIGKCIFDKIYYSIISDINLFDDLNNYEQINFTNPNSTLYLSISEDILKYSWKDDILNDNKSNDKLEIVNEKQGLIRKLINSCICK